MAFSNIGSDELTVAGLSTGSDTDAVAVPDLAANSIGIVAVNLGLTSQTVTGVTWNGVAMTAIPGATIYSGSYGVALFYLPNPSDNGTHNIVVTYDSTVIHIAHIVTIWADASAAVTLDDSAELNVTTDDPAITLTAVPAGRLVISSSSSNANDLVSISGATMLQDWDQGGNTMMAGYSIPVGTGDVTHTHDYGADGSEYRVAMASFEEAAGSSTETETFTVDGIIQTQANPQTFTVDGIIQTLANSQTFTADGIIQTLANPNTFTVDGIIQTLVNPQTFTADGIIQVLANEETFTVDGIINNTIQATFTVDGIIKTLANPSTFTCDGIIQTQGNQNTFTCDGIIKEINSQTFTVDGIIQTQANPTTHTADGIIQTLANQLAFTCDGIIDIQLANVTITADGIIFESGDAIYFKPTNRGIFSGKRRFQSSAFLKY